MPTAREQKNIDMLRLAGKSIAELAGSHGWASGCANCRHGMVNAPELNALSTNPLYLQRAVQAANHDITFCTCEAGKRMRAYLARVWVAELKGKPIEADIPVPTIHYEKMELVKA